MADPTLKGNGTACPRCEGRALVADWERAEAVVCPACGGLGRVAVPPAEIVAAMLAESKAAGGRDG
jgi:DNA-directed RNA polymerase subunit RPC12/RpoP